MNNDLAPRLLKHSYRCPHCGVVAQQDHADLTGYGDKKWILYETRCHACKDRHLWKALADKNGRMDIEKPATLIYPTLAFAPQPADGMPNSIKEIYDEAAKIYIISPRAAGALLRLTLELLLEKTGIKGKDLYHKIGNFVKQDIDEDMAKAMDVVRHTVGKMLHTSGINLKETTATIEYMFAVVNKFADNYIGWKEITEKLYKKLPKEIKESIGRRDGKSNSQTSGKK